MPYGDSTVVIDPMSVVSLVPFAICGLPWQQCSHDILFIHQCVFCQITLLPHIHFHLLVNIFHIFKGVAIIYNPLHFTHYLKFTVFFVTFLSYVLHKKDGCWCQTVFPAALACSLFIYLLFFRNHKIFSIKRYHVPQPVILNIIFYKHYWL